MGWLETLLDVTDGSECPKPFILWSGIAAIAAAVKKNVFISRGGVYNLYPNLFVLIVADSGSRKSYAIWLCRQVLEKVPDVRIISGRNSIEQVITDIGKAYTLPSGGPPITKGNTILLSSEFSSFLTKSDDALTILTDVFDTHYYEKEWKYSLKSGIVTIKEPCISLLAGTAPVHFKDKISMKDLEGGFIARNAVIYTDQAGTINSLVDEAMPIDLEGLRDQLLSISRVKGQFQYSAAAKALFKDWYEKHRKSKFEDKTGAAGRIQDQILKVAMCLSLSRSDSLILEEEDIDRAIGLCVGAFKSVNHIIRGSGKSAIGPLTHQVAIAIYNSPDQTISRDLLLRNFYGDFDSNTLDNIIRTLTEAKMIKIAAAQGGRVVYEMLPNIVELWRSYEVAQMQKGN